MRYFLGFFFGILTVSVSAQNTKKLNGNSPEASLDQVSWIAGHWQGEVFGGIAEEVWTPPLGDSMMGSFKLVIDGKVDFYEICVIRQVGETIMLQLKHFHGDLNGWEEKDETIDFPLVEVGSDVIFFDGLTFKKITEDEMHVAVVVSEDDEMNEIVFKYFRVNK